MKFSISTISFTKINKNKIAILLILLLSTSVMGSSVTSITTEKSDHTRDSVFLPNLSSDSTELKYLNQLTEKMTGSKNLPENKINEEYYPIHSGGFIKNIGQVTDSKIQYYLRGEYSTIAFSQSQIHFYLKFRNNNIKPVEFTISFPGSNPVTPFGIEKLSSLTNYFVGTMHITDIPSYKEVWFYDIYDGIDLRYYTIDNSMKYDFIIHPGADPYDITVEINEAVNITVDPHQIDIYQKNSGSSLLMSDTNLEVRQADFTPIQAKFKKLISDGSSGNRYQFELIDNYNRSQDLIIDPVWLGFSTYLGGDGSDIGRGIDIDDAGNMYVVGYTSSLDFPILNSYQNNIDTDGSNYNDVFIAKLNSSGGLIFSTYLGGDHQDYGIDIVIDDGGNSYITGYTFSYDFPTVSQYQSNVDTDGNSNADVFVTKLSSSGSTLLYSTYIGGSSSDYGFGITIDSENNTYITGRTNSIDYPVINPYQTNADTDGNSFSDIIVTKINNTGNSLIYSTYIGGDGYDYGNGIEVDDDNNAYIIGYTTASNYPTYNSIQNNTSTDNSTFNDVVVTKLNSSGNGLIFSTYLGGDIQDYGTSIIVDQDFYTYITGYTTSSNFPVVNPYQSNNDTDADSGFDVFVAKLNPNGSSLNFSTYLGGDGDEYGNEIIVDEVGNTFITGYTTSSNFPTIHEYQTNSVTDQSNAADVFVTRLNSSGNGLLVSTYLGGSSHDYGTSLALDNTENIYITGYTSSSDYPTLTHYQDNRNTDNSGSYDAIISKISNTIDFDSPNISLIGNTNNTILRSGTQIDISITDNLSGIDLVLYNWDETDNQTLLFPYSIFVPEGDYTHILRIYVNDTVGNVAFSEYYFRTDDSAPFFTQVPPDSDHILNSGTIIEISVVDDYLDTVYYNWDNTTNQTSSESEIQTALPSDNGIHILYIYANDMVNNWNFTTYTFVTDDIAPEFINIFGIEEEGVYDGTFVISVDLFDINGISRIEFYLDDNLQTIAFELPYRWVFNSTNVADGQYVITIHAYDIVGNHNMVTYTIIIENNPEGSLSPAESANGFITWQNFLGSFMMLSLLVLIHTRSIEFSNKKQP